MDEHDPRSSWKIYLELHRHAQLGSSHGALVELVLRLFAEVEALRTALADPAVPASVRTSYREAVAQTMVLAHNAAGPTGGGEKILRRFYPEAADRLAPAMAMLTRLGATPEQLAAVRAEIEEVEFYT